MTNAITIEIHLFASLQRSAKRYPQVLKLRAKTSVRDVIKRLAIVQEEIHLVFVNGRAASLDSMLQDGDRLAIFPPIGGG